MASYDMLASPVATQGRQGEDAIDASLATALQRNMSFAEDRKRQHTPSTANRSSSLPRRLRKAEHESEEQKENSIPASSSGNKVTPSRLACIKQLEQEMTCSVCLDICVRPCTTPCGHDFCRKCLKQALRHQRRCPKCRTSIPASAPICINTVLWNTIKLLFPHHAANAPESPADAIQTPSRGNTAAMTQALAAVPNAVMRQMANAPFNPPRRTRALSPRQPVQRMPPSWLEGATRDSDPPDPTARRHRLALSSRNTHHQQQHQQPQAQQQAQQRTLPQTFGRWEVHAAPSTQGQDLNMDDPHVQAMQPVLIQPRRHYGPGNQPQRQQSTASSMQRPSIQPSLLDNLQQRLDTLPIPDVFNGSQRFQETAAGMERSPSLRVRPFSHQPTQRQGRHPAAVSRAAAQPSNMFMRRNQPTAQLHAARQPVLESNAAMHQSPGPVQGYASNGHQAEQWHLDDLPDTPEAPRAATAAQNQAVADALFDTAVSESALGQGGLPAEPSWLHDAAAYDTAAAELDTDGLDALEILSDDDDNDSASMPGITSAAGSSLALTSLDQLVLSSDSEDDSVVADSIDVPASSSATPQHARLRLLQQVLRSGAAAEQHAPALPASSATAASAAAVHMSSGLLLGSTEQLAPDVIDLAGSPPPTAAGHDSMQRTALSDVTSSFPAEQQQQQADQPADAPVADKPFTLQRRRRPVCREPTQCIIADQLASSSSAVIALSAADPDSSVVEFEAQSAQDYAAAAQPAGQSTNAGAAAVSPVAVARCTRSQARRNHHPNVSQQGLAQPESLEAPKPQSNDDAVVSQDGRAELPDSHSQAVSSNRQHAQVQQTGINRPQRTVKNRPRLQLNRAARHE